MTPGANVRLDTTTTGQLDMGAKETVRFTSDKPCTEVPGAIFGEWTTFYT